jgi:glycosyltransferase involved in cell wall biosynthesis
MDLSIIIPALNAVSTLGAQLDALEHQQWDGRWEVVVADNGSTDGTRDLVLARVSGGRIRLVDASDAKGAAHARNAGTAATSGRSIAFCDADDVVAPGWVAAVGEALRQAPFVTGPQERALLNEPWLREVWGTTPPDRPQVFAGILPFGPTANLGLQRWVFEQAGGFDPSVTVYEDVDLCRRLWAAGVPLTHVPEAVVHYRHRSSLGGLFRQALTYGAAHPAIVRSLSEEGRPTPPRLGGLRSWLWLVRRLVVLRTRAGRARWVVVAGGSLGRLVGSVRHRFLFL